MQTFRQLISNHPSTDTPLKRATRARRSAFSLLLAFTLGACAVHLIGDYDEAIDTGISDIYQSAENRLQTLQSDPMTPYDPAPYDDMTAKLTVLRARAAALSDYAIIGQQMDNLRIALDDLRKLDKISSRPVSQQAFSLAETSLGSAIEPILKLEIALKRGQTPVTK